MPSIFMSFVHEDQVVAEVTKSLVETELALPKGVFASSDKSAVYAGDPWLQKITGALKESKVVILLLSKRSIGRPWVNFEAGGGWLSDKKVIPCCYGNMAKDRLPHPYSALQALNLRDEAHYLLESIHHHLDLKTPKPVSPRVKYFKELITTGTTLGTIQSVPSFDDWLQTQYGDPYKALESALDNFKDI